MFEGGREAVVAGLSQLASLTPGRTGNLSARDGDRVAITPSGVPYADIAPEDVPVLSMDGSKLRGDLEPSSEVPMHLGIYRELDADAIVHVHSPWATTLAVLNEPVPAVHYMVALAGGEVPVAAYERYGTEALAQNAVDAMREHETTACLLANHGLVAAGPTVQSALETARAVESTARVYVQARSIGEPRRLSDEQLSAVAEQFASYGQPEET